MHNRIVPAAMALFIALGAQDVLITARELRTRGLRGNKSYSISVALPGKAPGLGAAQVADQVRARLPQTRIAIDPEIGGGIHPPRPHIQLDVVGPTPDGWYAVLVRTLGNDNLVKSSLRNTPATMRSIPLNLLAGGKCSSGAGRNSINFSDRFSSDQVEMNSAASR